MKHTDGYWRVDINCSRGESQERVYIYASGRCQIAEILRFNPYPIQIDEYIANAKLMASSPELLDACESCLETIEQLVPFPELEAMKIILLNAIKKATE